MSEINRYGISGGAAVQVATGYFPEGQPPSSLNDGSRTLMADVRRYVEQTTPETTATYSAGAYTLALTRDLSAGELTQGFTTAFIAGSTNSASATLNINSTGAKNLLDNAGTHIVGEAIQNHQPVNVVYDKKKDGFRVTDQLKTIAELSPVKLSGVDELTASAVHTTNLSVTSINGGQIGGNRNFVRNGDMAVAQRTTQSIATTNFAYGACDGWKMYMGSAAEVDASQDAESPDGFNNSLKLDITTADTSVAAGDIAYIEQRFEGLDCQSINKGDAQAKSLTLSFWVRSPVTGIHIVELMDFDNSNRSSSQSYTISSADTWEYHSVIYPPDTTGTLDDDNAASLKIQFWLIAGTDYNPSSGTSLNTSWSTTAASRAVGQVNVLADNSDNFYLTGCQLELGEVATNFEYQTYGANLARSQRYYQAVNRVAHMGGTQLGYGEGGRYTYPQTMRAAPTNTFVAWITRYGGYSSASTATAAWNPTKESTGFYAIASSTQTAGSNYIFTFDSSSEL